jgi:hypothetical protein
MTEDVPVQGQGSSHFIETTSDIFKAKGEDDSGIPSEGGIEPSNPIKRSRDPHDHSLALLESASVATSRPLSDGAWAPTRIPRYQFTRDHWNSPIKGGTVFPTPPPFPKDA